MTMKKSSMSLVKFGSRVALAAGFSGLSSLVVAQSQPLEARVIVQYTAGSGGVSAAQAGPTMSPAAANESRMRNLGLRSGLILRSGRHVSPDMHVVTAQGMTSAQLAQQLSRQPGVAFAVEDRLLKPAIVPADPLYTNVPDGGGGETTGPTAGQWYLKPPGSVFNSSINAEHAWDFSGFSAVNAVKVAVLDTGIRADHPDFRTAGLTNVVPGYDFVSNDIMSGDSDTVRDSDASDPGDWTSGSELGAIRNCTLQEKSSWHGTKTAGLIGANSNNGEGMASVGGRTVQIQPIRVLGKCGGFESDVIAGMRWAAGLSVPGVGFVNNPKAQVLNMSLGVDGPCNEALADAVKDVNDAGVVVVAAAGNSMGRAVSAPANCSGVIAVGAVNHSGTKTSYSNLGSEVTISAPGGNCNQSSPDDPCLFPLLTTTNLGTTFPETYAAPSPNFYTDSRLDYPVGTSFAAPLVSGTIALMLANNPTLTRDAIKALLQQTARAFPSMGDGSLPQCKAPNPANVSQFDQLDCYCTTSTCGAGMLDAGAAVQLLYTNGQPKITTSSAAPRAQESLTLSANTSVVPAGRTITAYAWTLTDGGGIVSRFESGADTATATVTPIYSGRFAVRLIMTDNTAQQYSVSQSVEVANATPAPPSASPGAQRSTGGGSLQPFTLLGLSVAVMLLWGHRRRSRR